MSTMFDALRNCGLVSSDEIKKADGYYPYEKFSDYRLPFGSCTCDNDEDLYYEHSKTCLRSVNYLREHAEALTLEQFDELCPVLDKNDKTYKFLCNHIDKVRLVNEGSIHVKYDGIIGEHSSWDEKEYVHDVAYGLSDVIFYVTFSVQYMRLIPRLDMGHFNYRYQSDLKYELIRKFGFDDYGTLNEADALSAICYFLDRSEFIPLKIFNYDGVVISHKMYRDAWGMKHEAVQSPALGLNIKKHEKIMEGLCDFISKGGKIFDNRLYLILESKYEKGSYYLRNYDKIKDGEE